MSFDAPTRQKGAPEPMPTRSLFWPFSGGEVRDIGADGSYVAQDLAPAGPGEVLARVDAVCVCSSDVKIIRMGVKHPLFNARDLGASPVILGHEVALTVLDVGRDWRNRFRPGERLGLQPAMQIDGKRLTVGMDLPGGFSQHMRLDVRMLDEANPYVFPLPDGLSAAEGAMLEPYSCVEAAYRPNCRTSLKPGGRLLVVGLPGGDAATLTLDVTVETAVLVNPPAALRAWAEGHAGAIRSVASLDAIEPSETFDDIVVCGAASAENLVALQARMAVGGLLALVTDSDDTDPVPVDAARIHYQSLSFVGAPGPDVEAAFDPARNRFDFRPGGTALILGAGGAMGRIHVHRALDLDNGPAVVLATSRKGRRCDALREDFEPLAAQRGKRLIVVEDGELERAVATHAPDGCDDVAVVAPDVAAVERGAGFVRPDGMLVVFSGMPFGQPCSLPLQRIAGHGARFTGSTGSLVEDQIAVLDRIRNHGLDLTGNLEAVAGFGALPEALEAVMEGRVCGKVAIYPGALDLPLTPIERGRGGEKSWDRSDEAALAGSPP